MRQPIPDKWFSCQIDGINGKLTLIFNADDLEMASKIVYGFLTFGLEKVVSPVVPAKKSAIKGLQRYRGDSIHSVYRIHS